MSIASKNSASGLFGSTASAMSYHICGVSSPHGPAVTVPSGKLIVRWLATRAQVERNHRRSGAEQALRLLLFETLPHPKRLRRLVPMLAAARLPTLCGTSRRAG